ncbi:MAG: HEAT repeat domain-containing protein [Thermoproteota archaeon]
MEHKLREVISQDNVEKFSKLASTLKWGKPSWSASQLLLEVLKDEKKRLWLWANKLSKCEDPFTRRYASRILAELWETDKNKVVQMLTALADDENWLVREDAHAVWSELFKDHFQQVFPVLRKWSKHSSPNLRRCVAIAVRSAGNLRKEEWAEPLIQLLEPLLSDKNSYVRKNLGPYAIGDGLLRCYPDFTLKRLRRWSHRDGEGTRWNVAMAFASYGGNKNWQEGIEILATLAKDERR